LESCSVLCVSFKERIWCSLLNVFIVHFVLSIFAVCLLFYIVIVVMDLHVFNDWLSGIRTFHGIQVSSGVFEIINCVLNELQRQQGAMFTVNVDCETLLATLQSKINNDQITLTFTTAAPPAGPSQQSSSSAIAPTQPGPSRSTKRLSTVAESGPAAKRTRVETSSPQSGVSDGELSSLSISPIPIIGPTRRVRNTMRHIDTANCLRNRLRTSPTETDLYQEPQHADWGMSGQTANCLPAFMPTRRRQKPLMQSCTHCYCRLRRPVRNDAATPAVCVLCGNYKARNVSLRIFYSLTYYHALSLYCQGLAVSPCVKCVVYDRRKGTCAYIFTSVHIVAQQANRYIVAFHIAIS